MRHPRATRRFHYGIGRIPGVGPNMSVQSLRRVGPDQWSIVRIRNIGSGARAMRIARLIGRL